MYPYIDILNTRIHMTGIAIIAFVLSFLWYSKKYTKKNKLDRSLLWKNVPVYCIIIYFTASYSRYFINDFVIFPLSLTQIMKYISPYQYEFHLTGILAGCAGCLRHFFGQIKDRYTQVKWVDTLFLSIVFACVPLGFFLLLGDTFIGQPTESVVSVSAIHADSKVATFDKVIPLGLYLSVISIILFLSTRIYTTKNPTVYGFGFYGMSIFLVLFCILILFQIYPRHAVFSLLGKTRDIKNYALILSALLISSMYLKKYAYYSKLK